MPKNTLAAGLIVFRRLASTIEYLLMQTSYGEHHWTPPKGHLDAGETDLTAAIRETREEAGLEENKDYVLFKKDTAKIVSKYVINGTKPKQVTYWLAEVNDVNTKIVMSDEHIAFKWLQLSEACEIVKYEEMKHVLREAERIIAEA